MKRLHVDTKDATVGGKRSSPKPQREFDHLYSPQHTATAVI